MVVLGVLAAPFTAIVSRFVLGTSVGYEHVTGIAVMLISFAHYYAGEELFRPLEEPATSAASVGAMKPYTMKYIKCYYIILSKRVFGIGPMTTRQSSICTLRTSSVRA